MKLNEAIATLKELGLREGWDYYIENIYRVTTYFQARSVCIVSESDYEDGNYDAYDKAEIEDEMHNEKDIVGFEILDADFKKTSIEELSQKFNREVPNGRNNCAICSKPLMPRGSNDQRKDDNGLLRCFDHIGQPIMEASPNGQTGKVGED